MTLSKGESVMQGRWTLTRLERHSGICDEPDCGKLAHFQLTDGIKGTRSYWCRTHAEWEWDAYTEILDNGEVANGNPR